MSVPMASPPTRAFEDLRSWLDCTPTPAESPAGDWVLVEMDGRHPCGTALNGSQERRPTHTSAVTLV